MKKILAAFNNFRQLFSGVICSSGRQTLPPFFTHIRNFHLCYTEREEDKEVFLSIALVMRPIGRMPERGAFAGAPFLWGPWDLSSWSFNLRGFLKSNCFL
jgi:hypothetical protein